MAHSITFDTLAFVKKLEASGISALKMELKSLKMELKADLKTLEAQLKADLIKWIVSLLFAQTTIIVSIMAIIKFIH